MKGFACFAKKIENSLKVENELHFVMECPLYENKRLDTLQAIRRTHPNTELVTNENYE